MGSHGEAATRCVELLLCRMPNRPIQFSVNAPALTSTKQLIARASSDIIGKKAGRIVFGLGLNDFRQNRGDASVVGETYQEMADEILKKTFSQLFFLTIPVDFLPEIPDQVEIFNERVRGFASLSEERVRIMDFAKHVERFKEMQVERGKFARSLFSEDAKPTSLCITLLSLFMQDCILETIK